LLGGVSLRQCEWDRADGHEQKQIKRASDKVRFDGGINLFFHRVVSLACVKPSLREPARSEMWLARSENSAEAAAIASAVLMICSGRVFKKI